MAFLSALMSAFLTYQIYRLDVKRKFRSFLPVMLATGVWAFFSGLWLLLPDTIAILASKLSYAGVIALPVFLFLFALDYSGSPWHAWFSSKKWVLWVIPALSVLALATNPLHGLFWNEILPVQVLEDDVVYKGFPGTWFVVHSIYSYGLVIVAAVILLQAFRSKRTPFNQSMFLAGILPPMTTSILYVFNVTGLDYTPLLLTLAVVFFAFAISQEFYFDNIAKIRALQNRTTDLNRLYHMVVRVSERLIQSEPEQIDTVIDEVLGLLGKETKVDRTYIFLYDEGSDTVSNTHEWCRKDIPSEKENLQNIPFSKAVPRWRKVLMNKGHIYIPVVKDLPENDMYRDEKAILEPQGIQSAIVVPLFSGGSFSGFAGFDSVRRTRKWDHQSIALLTLAASIIAGSLDRVSYENELISARDKAEKANRVKMEFLANMSHELRTPLNAIMGFTSIVAHELPPGENRQYLEVALKSSQVLLQLINDLLDFSKAEAGMLTIRPVETDLSTLLEFVKNTFLPVVEEKNIDMQVVVHPETPKTFIIDEARMRQVLFNLVGNAVKFTDEGHVKIIAEAEPVRPENPVHAMQAEKTPAGSPEMPGHNPGGSETPGTNTPRGNTTPGDGNAEENTAAQYTPHRLTITVEDTGIGIRQEDQESIFQEFTQVSYGNTRKYDGTGLGLNIARRLVSLMGGEISVDSEIGKGSRFTVTLHNLPGKTG